MRAFEFPRRHKGKRHVPSQASRRPAVGRHQSQEIRAAVAHRNPPADEAASAGLRDSTWSSQLGRLHLANKITSAQFAAGKRWATLVADYAVACSVRIRPAQPNSTIGGMPADPDSATGVEKRAATSAPPRTTWTVAARFALPAARPSASSTAFACRIRRRRVFMNSKRCEPGSSPCRHGGSPGASPGAMAAAKARSTKLGNPRPETLTFNNCKTAKAAARLMNSSN